jgi:hypothetical protein
MIILLIMIEQIRKHVDREEFDYQTLIGVLAEYASPRDKITDLLRKGFLIRVKKGLYVFGEFYRKRPYSLELLANLIYGPSYISLDYALQYYGLIPERVETITSVTTGRSKKFSTPVGTFTYQSITLLAFQSGMNLVGFGDGGSCMIALPEKALADKIRSDRGTSLSNQKDMHSYLFDNLRLDLNSVKEMDPDLFEGYADSYRSKKIRLLSKLIRGLNKGKRDLTDA